MISPLKADLKSCLKFTALSNLMHEWSKAKNHFLSLPQWNLLMHSIKELVPELDTNWNRIKRKKTDPRFLVDFDNIRGF
jgi:hypothetical protein